MPSALITGIAGQDGSYLAELLLAKKYRVYGTVRARGASLARIAPILKKVRLIKADLSDQRSVDRAIAKIKPDEVYNLAGQSFLLRAVSRPLETGEVTALGVARLLDAIRRHSPKSRFFQASSAEMYGRAVETPQTESTPLFPLNPYAAAKTYAHSITGHFREAYGLYAVSGILYNHESPRRGTQFAMRKITHGAASIKLGLMKELRVGDIKARRDWGFSGDYVRAMHLALCARKPEDYVIATGVTHSVEELLETAFSAVGLDWKKYVKTDRTYMRPGEAAKQLRGNAAKARRRLGWRPQVSFKELVRMMVRADLERLAPTS